MKTETKVLILATAVGGSLWIGDAAVDSLFFSKEPFLDVLILETSPYELYMRTTILLAMVAIGVISAALLRRGRLARVALIESQRRFEAFMEHFPGGAFIRDKENRFVFVNPMMAEVLGQPVSRVLGRPASDFLAPETAESSRAQDRLILATGEPFQGEDLVQYRGSSRNFMVSKFPIPDERGKNALVGGISIDSTELKRAEESLRESEERFRQIAETIPDAFWTADKNISKMFYISPGYERIWGRSLASLHENPRSFLDPIHPDDQARVLADLDAQKSDKPFAHEYRILRPDGTVRWIADSGFPVREPTGEVRRYVGIARDITERKRAETEIRHRLEVERLVAGISHHFIEVGLGALDAAIVDALGAIGVFAGVDRTYLFQLSPDGTTHSNTHEWCAPGIAPQQEALQNLPTDAFPWIMARLNRFETVHVPRTADLPPEAARELEAFEAGQVKSLMVVPLVRGQSLVGFLGFDSVRAETAWSEPDVTLLRMVGEIFVSALLRRRGEETLRQSEDRYHALAENLAEGLAIVDRGEVVRYSNPANDRIFGVTPGLLVGRSVKEFVNEAGLAALGRQSEARAEGLTTTYELEIIRPDGESRTLLLTGTPQSDDEGRFVATFGIVRDITERKHVQEALERRDAILTAVAFAAQKLLVVPRWRECCDEVLERLGEASRASRSYIFEILPARDGTLLVSQRFEWVGEGVSPQIEKPERQSLPVAAAGYSRWVEVLTHGGIIHGAVDTFPESERVVPEAAGVLSLAAVPIFVAGRLWGFIGFDDCSARRVWSLTELESLRAAAGTLGAAIQREIAEGALRESEGRFRTLVETSPDGVGIVVDGRVAFSNVAMGHLVGLDDPRGMLGRVITDFLPEGNRAAALERVSRTTGQGEVPPPFEETLLRPDGALVTVEIAQTPTTWAGERAVQVVMRDLTQRKVVQARLAEIQRLEVAALLAGGIAHDFNNLLQAVLSHTQLLLAHSEDVEQVRARAREIEERVAHGASLTRQLLVFSQREVVKAERVDLNEVVRTTADLLHHLIRENVTVHFDLATVPLPIEADLVQLEQVVINLAVNASEAMPGGGRLTLATGVAEDGGVELVVRDTGRGIPKEIRDHIFEPFFSTKHASEGAGLGLAVVHGIVSQHGGRIEVESEVGKGTTLRITLPRKVSGEFGVVSEAAVAPQGLSEGRRERVLLVEDEAAARGALTELLTMLGYEVVAVGSGEEAQALPDQPPFHLLLTDLLLPEISGAEVARVLAARWGNLKVIVMSGFAEDEAVRRGVATGAVRFLQKPFDMATLAREVRAALAD
jgi:PAS domain S-box-containing protein